MKKTEESNKTFWFIFGTFTGFAVCHYLFNKEPKWEDKDLKKEIEKVKIEVDILRKISVININNNKFSPSNNVQQTAANPTPNQVSPKEATRLEKFQKALKLFCEAITGK